MSDDRWIAAPTNHEAEALAARHVDLAHPRLGTRVVSATDDFFAPKERLIDPAPPIFAPDRYDDNGKWMDGWESRRRRGPGHDWCVVALGVPGRVRVVDIDTSFFTGNFPPEAAVEAWAGPGAPDEGAEWTPIVPRRPLGGDAHNIFAVDDERVWSHLRLHIYPDGGVARLRVFGDVHKDWSAHTPGAEADLAAVVNGGRAVAWNNAHYCMPVNLLAPGRGANPGDGWETARRRGPGNDWAVFRLGAPGRIVRAVVDTAHYKGNYPDRCSLRAARLASDDSVDFAAVSAAWPEILPAQKLGPDAEHVFAAGLVSSGPVTHVRLDIFPDGGVSRLRLFGVPETGMPT